MKYDVFISYSRRDKAFTDELQKALARYTLPKQERSGQRHLRIFRDTEDLVGADYYQSIEQNLKSSAKLILICSPMSAKSQFVNDEVKNFAALNHPKNIIPLLLDGLPNNEAKPGQEDLRAFPPALCDALTLPLAISYQGINLKKNKPHKSPYDDSWYTMLASLLDIGRAELEQREQRRRRQQLTITLAVTSSIILVLAALAIYAFLQKNKADDQTVLATQQRDRANVAATIATSQKIAASALSLKENKPDLAALLSVEAARRVAEVNQPDDLEVHNALLSTTHANSRMIALLHYPGRVVDVAFSPVEKVMASGSADGKICFWDVAKNQLLGTPLDGHKENVLSLAFSPDGKVLASSGSDSTIRFWDVTSRKPLGEPLKKHQTAVRRVIFSPDGKTLASASEDGTILLWDVQARTVQGDPLQAGSVDIAFLPKGNALAVLTSSGFELLDLATRALIKEGADNRAFESGELGIAQLAASQDGTLLAAAAGPSVWFQPILSAGSELPRFGAANPADGEQRARGGSHSQQVYSLAFSPVGNLLASSSKDSTIKLWNTDENKEEMKLNGHSGPINALVYNHDGKLLASAGDDGNIALWDMGSSIGSGRTLEAHGPVAFRPNGNLVAQGLKGNTWYQWNMAGQRSSANGQGESAESANPDQSVRAVSPDGKIIAEVKADADGAEKLQLWSAEPRKALAPPLEGHEHRISSLAFSPDGKILASGSLDKTIRLWDVTNKQLIGSPLTGFAGAIQSLAFSPDGKTLAVGTGDNRESDENFSTDTDVHAVHLWNVEKRLPLGAPLSGYKGYQVQVAFSPDGKTLATWTNDEDDKVVLIDLGNTALMESLCRRANRNLSFAEWKQYLGDSPYRRTCPAFPPGEGAPKN